LLGVGLIGTNHLNNVLLRDDVLATTICDIEANSTSIALDEITKSGNHLFLEVINMIIETYWL